MKSTIQRAWGNPHDYGTPHILSTACCSFSSWKLTWKPNVRRSAPVFSPHCHSGFPWWKSCRISWVEILWKHWSAYVFLLFWKSWTGAFLQNGESMRIQSAATWGKLGKLGYWYLGKQKKYGLTVEFLVSFNHFPKRGKPGVQLNQSTELGPPPYRTTAFHWGMLDPVPGLWKTGLEECDQNRCWLMMRSGIILACIYWYLYIYIYILGIIILQYRKSRSKATRIKWNEGFWTLLTWQNLDF